MNKLILGLFLALILGSCLALGTKEELLKEKKGDLVDIENAISMDQILIDAAKAFPQTITLQPNYISMKEQQLAGYNEIKELLEFEIKILENQSEDSIVTASSKNIGLDAAKVAAEQARTRSCC